MIQVKNENTPNLPEHLAGLLQPTPSGVVKLVAAWDGLSMESQMMLLTALERTDFPGYLADRILTKALDSENAYVRYLAVKKLYVILYLWLGTHQSKREMRIPSMQPCRNLRSSLACPRKHGLPTCAIWRDGVKSWQS